MATDSWDEFPTSPPPAATPAGMVAPGNVNLDERPVVHNEDGTIDTVKSLGIGVDGKEVLIPTVAEDGSRILSHDEAIAQYHETGHHLGIFDTPENATAYGKAVSAEQDRNITGMSFLPRHRKVRIGVSLRQPRHQQVTRAGMSLSARQCKAKCQPAR